MASWSLRAERPKSVHQSRVQQPTPKLQEAPPTHTHTHQLRASARIPRSTATPLAEDSQNASVGDVGRPDSATATHSEHCGLCHSRFGSRRWTDIVSEEAQHSDERLRRHPSRWWRLCLDVVWLAPPSASMSYAHAREWARCRASRRGGAGRRLGSRRTCERSIAHPHTLPDRRDVHGQGGQRG